MQSFVGHGDSINEIRTQALKPSLVVSASKVSGMIIFAVLDLQKGGKDYWFIIFVDFLNWV